MMLRDFKAYNLEGQKKDREDSEWFYHLRGKVFGPMSVIDLEESIWKWHADSGFYFTKKGFDAWFVASDVGRLYKMPPSDNEKVLREISYLYKSLNKRWANVEKIDGKKAFLSDLDKRSLARKSKVKSVYQQVKIGYQTAKDPQKWQRIKRLEELNVELSDRLKGRKKEIDRLEKELKKASKKMASMENMADELESMKAKVDTFWQEKLFDAKKMKEKQNKLKELEGEIEDLFRQNRLKDKKMEQLQKKQKEQLDGFNKYKELTSLKLKHIETQKRQYERQIEGFKKEEGVLKTKLEESRELRKRADEKLEALGVKVKDIENVNKENVEKSQKLTAQKDKSQMQIKNYLAKEAEYKKKIKELEQVISKKEREKEGVLKLSKETMGQLKIAKRNATKAEGVSGKMEREVLKYSDRIKELEKENRGLKQENAAIRGSKKDETKKPLMGNSLHALKKDPPKGEDRGPKVGESMPKKKSFIQFFGR